MKQYFDYETVEREGTTYKVGHLRVVAQDYENGPAWDVNDFNACDTNGVDDAPSSVRDYIRFYNEKTDSSYASTIQNICDEYFLEYDLVTIGVDYYFYFDENEFRTAIRHKIANSDFDLESIYNDVKTNELIIDIEEMIVRDKVQEGIPVFYEGYYHKGDASCDELIEYANRHNIAIEDDNFQPIFDFMDKEHEKLIPEAILEKYGNKQAAILNLVEFGLHEGTLL